MGQARRSVTAREKPRTLALTLFGLFGVALPALLVSASPAAARQGSSYGSCNNPLVLVDQQHRLSSGYVPPDLVYPYHYGVPTTGYGELLRYGTAVNLSHMVADARANGIYLSLASGWRSYYTQASLYNYWSSIYGPGAGGVSAPPGSSQHQLGTAVDLTNAYAGYGLSQYFGYSYAYDWLLRNARYYGFVISYPSGAKYQTGYWWEPWHWRYVGVQNAINIVNSGLGLQGYLERYGVLPYC